VGLPLSELLHEGGENAPVEPLRPRKD